MSLELNAKSTALIAIDLQNGIVGRPELAPHAGKDVVSRSNEIADALRAAGGTIVWVHVLIHEAKQHQTDSPPMGGSDVPKEASDFVPEVKKQEGDIVITKRTWGAFLGTDLDAQLKNKSIKTIVMSGIATNIGVESTARSAFDLGYDIVFAEDATSTMGAPWHEFAVTNIFPRMGKVRSTEDVLTAIK